MAFKIACGVSFALNDCLVIWHKSFEKGHSLLLIADVHDCNKTDSSKKLMLKNVDIIL